MITSEQVLDVLRRVKDPELGRDIVSLGMVREVRVEGDRVALTVVLTTPACPLTERIEADIREALQALPGVRAVDLRMTAQVPSHARLQTIEGLTIKNILAVGSGKGGVGKSTMAANLAVALAGMGAVVGLMDADVYGPNIPEMLGVSRIPAPRDNRIIPAVAYGVRVMSLGFLLPPDQPVIWRGPMLHSAVRQFLTDVDWGLLDYLVVDLPPGTGDVAISLAQLVPVTGAVVVTTPQGVSVSDVGRAVRMFERLEIPVLGVVENMSGFVCPHCGQVTEIFGKDGGRRLAERMGVPFLGSVPLDPRVVAGGEAGRPVVIAYPDSPAAQALRAIAQQVAARISVLNLQEPAMRTSPA
ncbi:Mrp/NBP35 family ATP-binding protein [Thermoflexus sp.]|uniref:Mrp/NBP35 family ATP-binding protein n=1 Tax=Thermoflexus sp. TaxID=1969742 RepID=UPI0025EFBECC|nr:Mrp/NBP35 family ATP-binding protein [Thermoflexus sp.]MCS6964296.1 Mrp/NBP35 family ATP-binding protein [Thermoflexus sp.]MCX7689713.1 Mrp/NBP35 family ATP-binding protein [Thermoflexus sp.]MDW8185993.1 Mrp/NBP35 family ATP-binding protein [Anaerolineae bacterium]